ncbi:MAG: hypothetical protein ABIK98_11485 [Pseudomonadota bacterium]|uniref:Uncharacterized protein n=1 Tax=Candidatus Desulfatibia profunda TaxID=2841695 RepID=A0A8J6NSJ1_9BACT|nr:hypothetical protein [Candidatus Desulfatibia profunda]MBL7179975.1 hypothetical protein [Desulfobacterales bacterium]MBU0698222.1 hypothetical protein [Pseudomonadota bacterium]
MKLLSNITGFLFILLMPVMVQALDIGHAEKHEFKNNFVICQTGRQKALEQRGIKVTGDKDDLIRLTVRAYGGDYVRSGEAAALTLNGKTYQDFTVEIVEEKYLRIKTPEGTFILEAVEQ